MIDLRSDTVTLPSQAMRDAIAQAELGDDVMGEDPTVNRLEELAAEKMGKEAALLVTSGTMGNLVSLLSHCTRGQDVILGDQCHIFKYEAGGASALGGLAFHTAPTGRFRRTCPAGYRTGHIPGRCALRPAGSYLFGELAQPLRRDGPVCRVSALCPETGRYSRRAGASRWLTYL